MSKEYEYVKMVTKLGNVSLSDSIFEDAYARGNVAYLIESYYDTDEWEEITQRIDQLINENDVNALCGYIVSLIYQSVMISTAVNDVTKELYSTEMDLRKDLYQAGELRDFDLVVDFPEWFFAYDVF